MTAGPGPTDDLRTALAGLARDTARRPLLIALDFDGTLAPLVDDPDDSRLLPPATEALALIAGVPDVTLAPQVEGESRPVFAEDVQESARRNTATDQARFEALRPSAPVASPAVDVPLDFDWTPSQGLSGDDQPEQTRGIEEYRRLD